MPWRIKLYDTINKKSWKLKLWAERINKWSYREKKNLQELQEFGRKLPPLRKSIQTIIRGSGEKLPPQFKNVYNLAHEYGWNFYWFKPEHKNLRLSRSDSNGTVYIDVWIGKKGYTVGTILKHPKHVSKTNLFRRFKSKSELKAVFKNPRAHTGKGYYEK